MRLTIDDHAAQSWRIDEVATDFEVEDVWSIDTRGSAADFGRFVDHVSTPLARTSSGQPPLLLRIRLVLGRWLGWDRPEQGFAGRVTPLRDQLPEDVPPAPRDPATSSPTSFSPVFQLADEWAAEVANATVHGVLHLGWVRTENGSYRGQMAVLVRPNGWRGRLYLAAIKPFRLLVVYPAWIRRVERTWSR